MNYYKKPEAVKKVGFNPSFEPSGAQQAIFRAVKLDGANVHCSAVAGSGKSTTLKWLAKIISEIWERKNFHGKGELIAFNRDIVTDITPYLPYNFEASTFHKIGRSVIAANVPKVYSPNKWKVSDILSGMIEWLDPSRQAQNLKGKTYMHLRSANDLIDKIRVTLTDWKDEDQVRNLIDQYNIELPEERINDLLGELPKIFYRMLDKPGLIDFTDMIWMPIHMGWKFPKINALMVDEAQDMSAVAREICRAIEPDQFISVGDRNQSINGFAGANPNSIDDLIGIFSSVELPLSICYRCGKKIVEEAQKIVPEIQAFDGAIDGEVNSVFDQDRVEYRDGDMVLARKNSTLVRPAFKLLKQGRSATIKGKAIGDGFLDLIKSFNVSTIPELLDKNEEYRTTKIENLSNRSRPSESQIEFVIDQTEALAAMAEECKEVEELSKKISNLFSEQHKGVLFSSIHRSKGLEADHVTILDASNMELSKPNMNSNQILQERNLKYVAVTRPKKQLNFVYSQA